MERGMIVTACFLLYVLFYGFGAFAFYFFCLDYNIRNRRKGQKKSAKDMVYDIGDFLSGHVGQDFFGKTMGLIGSLFWLAFVCFPMFGFAVFFFLLAYFLAIKPISFLLGK